MSDKSERISINTFENIAKQNPSETSFVWEGIAVNIKTFLPFEDMLAFVSEVAESCFFEDGSYAPEMLDFMIRRGILTYYANFRMPQRVDKQYWLVMSTDAADVVREHIDTRQLHSIIDAIHLKIEHRCSLMISETQQHLNKLLSMMDSFTENMEDIFSKVSSDELSSLVSALGGARELSEDKIVAAYADRLRSRVEVAGDNVDQPGED